MFRSFGINLLTVSLAISFIAGDAYADKKNLVIHDASGNKNTKSVSTDHTKKIIVGGVLGTGLLAGTAGALTYLGVAGIITASAVTLSVAGAATLGAVPAAIILGALATWGSYKLYKKYKNHLMGVPSEIVASLNKKAIEINKTSKKKVTGDQLVQDFLKIRLDSICRENGFDLGADLDKTKKESRKVDLTSKFNGKFLSAYDEKGVEQKYSYIKGYPSIIVRDLQCRSSSTDFMTKDPGFAEYVKKLEQEAQANEDLDRSSRVAGRRRKQLPADTQPTDSQRIRPAVTAIKARS